MSDWERIGTIPVDGGQCVVGDPAYVRGVLNERHEQEDYSSGPKETGVGGSLAIIVDAGFGDGGYDVFVRRTPRTKVVAEVKVVFVPEGLDRCEAPGCEHGRVIIREPSGLEKPGRPNSGILVSVSKCPACDADGLAEVSA